MFTKLKAGGGDQYDIVFANAGFCPFYHDAGLIEPIDLDEIPAAKNLWPIFKTNTDFPYVLAPNKTLLYPSMWASFGICWNVDQFQVPRAVFVEVALGCSEGQGDPAGRRRRLPRARRPRPGRAPIRDLLDDRAHPQEGGRLSEAAEAVPDQQQFRPRDRRRDPDREGRRGPGDEPRPRLPDQREGGQARGGHPASQGGRARLGRWSSARQGRQEPRQRPQVHRLPHGRSGRCRIGSGNTTSSGWRARRPRSAS